MGSRKVSGGRPLVHSSPWRTSKAHQRPRTLAAGLVLLPVLHLTRVLTLSLGDSPRAWAVAAPARAPRVARLPRALPRHARVRLLSVYDAESREPGTSEQAPIEFTSLVEAPLPAVDLDALGEELSADIWSQESLLVKALLKEGAQKVEVSPPSSEDGSEREMSFLMRTGIPWNKVRAFLRMQGKEQEADAAVSGGEAGMSSVMATHQFDEISGDAIKMRSTYVVGTPRLNLHLQLALQKDQYSFDGGVEFFSWPSASFDLFQYGIVRKFMEASFMKALEHYGKTILAEVGRRAEKP